ncbi:MAG TPA: biotin/lipoyl-containing protein [Streptosporangiaceae bacterium]|nr:biotin/lipoyl-containing protein [Streptosporangiaceae bacterium]
MNLTDDDVRDILRLLDSLPFTELRLETDSFRLALRRGADGEWTQAGEVLSAPNELETGASAHPDAGGHADAGANTDKGGGGSPAAARDGLLEVRAPLLGTFYRAPRPGAEPFVEVGDLVEEHTVVGIIETMKLMNSVPAGVRGKVVEILVANAEFAERDAVLMLVAPE